MTEFRVASLVCLKIRWLKEEITVDDFSLEAYSIQSIKELLESLTNVIIYLSQIFSFAQYSLGLKDSCRKTKALGVCDGREKNR